MARDRKLAVKQFIYVIVSPRKVREVYAKNASRIKKKKSEKAATNQRE